MKEVMATMREGTGGTEWVGVGHCHRLSPILPFSVWLKEHRVPKFLPRNLSVTSLSPASHPLPGSFFYDMSKSFIFVFFQSF